MEEFGETIKELSRSIDNFTNDLFKHIAHENEDNFVFSALSAHYVLSMCLFGAKENTAEQMQNALRLDNPYDLAYWKQLLKSLENVRAVDLSIASKVYEDKSIIVKEKFQNVLKSTFNTAIESVNFTKPQDAVNAINKWCKSQTKNKIRKIIATTDINPLTTKMILVNVVYFKAYWDHDYRFETHLTKMEPFYIDKNTQKNFLTMFHVHPEYFYKDLKDLNAECVAIPYQNKDFLFLIIVPKEIDGIENLQKNIDKIPITYEDFSKDENWRPVVLKLPKFKIHTTLDLDLYLEKMGMIDAFSENANLKGISEEPIFNPPLHIDNVLQKSFIDVNELGTEAAAFNKLQIGLGCPKIHLTVNKPFLFKIINVKSKITLFSGRILDPKY